MSMRIIELRANNFKRLKAVEIKPDGSVVIVHGRNAQGKSSVLDAIWAALGGKKAVPPKPIREGEESCEITLDLGDYIVTRVFTESNTYLKVTNADGAKISNPQALLDSMIGSISFDPLEFARMKPGEQAANLAWVAKIDFEELNGKRNAFYDTRTDVNREVKRLGGAIAEIKKSSPDIESAILHEEVPIDDLMKQYEAATAEHGDFKTEQTRAESNGRLLLADEEERRNLICRLEALEVQIASSQRENEEMCIRLIAQEKKLPNLVEIQRKISDAGAVANHNRAVKNYTQTEQRRFEKAKEAASLSEQIAAVEQKKTDLVLKADLPVNGLTFDENGVFYNGVPFEQCSSSEQLKVSTAIAIGFKPTLRVIRINDGSLLDSENLTVLEEIAKAQDFQIWIERVDEGKAGVGVLIEDGQVVT